MINLLVEIWLVALGLLLQLLHILLAVVSEHLGLLICIHLLEHVVLSELLLRSFVH